MQMLCINRSVSSLLCTAILCVFLPLFAPLYAQEVHTLINNPSFENGIYGMGTIPDDWIDCGFSDTSPIDLHSADAPFFDVTNEAQHGKQYIGMVTRENQTWESICTSELMPAVSAQQLQSVQLWLAHAAKYAVHSQPNRYERAIEYNFTAPARLRVWGGHSPCDFSELLSETATVEHTDWRLYTLHFFPSKAYQYLHFEAYYPDATKPTNGNILIDMIGPVQVYADTEPHRAICIGGRLAFVIPAENNDLQQLKTWVQKYVTLSLERGVPVPALLRDIAIVQRFLKETSGNQVRSFLMRQKETEMVSVLQALRSIGAADAVTLLQEGWKILQLHRQGKASMEQLAHFETLDQRFSAMHSLAAELDLYLFEQETTILEKMNTCE